MIICGFPGVGKTTLAIKASRVIDVDSSSYSWVVPGERNPAWPGNYVEAVLGVHSQGFTVVCSTHSDFLDVLEERGVKAFLAYPLMDLRQEYLRRYVERGNPPAFLDLMQANWDEWLDCLSIRSGFQHIPLSAGEFLADWI